MPELPDPYGKMFLSDEELRTVARIVINWAHADSVLGLVLEGLYRIRGESASDLIHSLEMSRKIDLLIRFKKRRKLADRAHRFLAELKYAHDNYKQIRNLFSHGMILADDAGNWTAMSFKGQKADPKELALALEQSKYAGLMANRILMALGGLQMPATSFERPPARLPQS
jgi:hypothetical protein